MRRRLLPVLLSVVLLASVAPPAQAAPDINTVLDLTFPVDLDGLMYPHAPVTDTYWASRSGGRGHRSSDIMAWYGTPVHAAVGGRVTDMTYKGQPYGFWGYQVTIRGDDGLEHEYLHLGRDDRPVSEAYAPGLHEGDRVQRGQLIGYVGCSGTATCGGGEHLHYSIEDPRYPAQSSHYDKFRYNPYPSLVAALTRGDVPGSSVTPVQVTGAGTPGRLHSMLPTRMLDTRDGTGAPIGQIAGGTTTRVRFAGVAGIPADATAVAVNVTVTGPTRSGYVTVHPGRTERPATSSVNFEAGQTVANMAIVKLGPHGELDVFNYSGQADVILDVSGWFSDDGGAGYRAVDPTRLLDTRKGVNGPRQALGPRESRDVRVAGVGPVPRSGVEAVLLNVTVTEPTGSGSYLTVHPSGAARPTASNLNFRRGDTVPNLVVAPVGPDGHVTVYNHSGTAHVLFDVAGYYVDGGPDDFVPVTPTRVLDTREGTGARRGLLSRTMTLNLSGLPTTEATAVVLNMTTTKSTLDSYLTAYPTGTARPVASNLNWQAGETRANLVVVRLGVGQRIDLFNYVGDTHVVADVMGYMTSG